MFKVSFTNNWGGNYSNFLKSTRKSKTGLVFHGTSYFFSLSILQTIRTIRSHITIDLTENVLHFVYLQFLLNTEKILGWDIFESGC